MNAKEWEKRISTEEKMRETYRRRCKRIDEIYSGDGVPFAETVSQVRDNYNILWVNCSILQSAIYARNPNPDVRARYKDLVTPQMDEMQKALTEANNKLGSDIALVTERALTYCQDTQDFYGNASSAVLSFVKNAAGLMRCRYSPVTEEGESKKISIIKGEDGRYSREDGSELNADMFDSVEMGEDGFYLEEPGEEKITYEELQPEYVPMNRFHWETVSEWKDVSWCVIDHYMTKDELVEQFGEKEAENIPLYYSDNGSKLNGSAKAKGAKALVRECFDKRNLTVEIYPPDCDDIFVSMDDPYKLTNFYPFPKPMFDTMGTDGINPVPDYIYYQDQHAELNTITERLSALLKVAKYRGIYDGSMANLVDVENMVDGQFSPTPNYAELAATMGGAGVNLQNLIAEMPIANVLGLITFLYQARQQVVTVIHEITGISDIMRGSTNPNETLGAQELKGQYASIRIQNKKKEAERFFRDYMRIEAEFICERFEIETLELMTGIKITPEMEQVMSKDLLRSYIVDVETDSTSMVDSRREQSQRIEALQALSSSFAQLAPLVQMGLPINLVGQMVLFGLKGFKGGRELEDLISNIIDTQDQDAQQPKEPTEEEMIAKQEAMRGLKLDNDEKEARIAKLRSESAAQDIENDAVESGIIDLMRS